MQNYYDFNKVHKNTALSYVPLCRTFATIKQEKNMVELSVNKFRANLKKYIEKTLTDHIPLRVNRQAGKDFILMSAEDWESEQETLYILQSKSLIKQIAESTVTYNAGTGNIPSQKDINEINSI